MKSEKSFCALGTKREVSFKRHTVYFSNALLKLLLSITGVRQQQRHLNFRSYTSRIYRIAADRSPFVMRDIQYTIVVLPLA